LNALTQVAEKGALAALFHLSQNPHVYKNTRRNLGKIHASLSHFLSDLWGVVFGKKVRIFSKQPGVESTSTPGLSSKIELAKGVETGSRTRRKINSAPTRILFYARGLNFSRQRSYRASLGSL
jgi:hypothetical protein